MSKVATIIGVVAGVVAVVATGGAALAPLLGFAPTIFGVSLTAIAAVAGAVAAIASAVATATQKPPGTNARGSINEVLIGANMPIPYGMGRSYVGGNQVYEDSAGTKNSDKTRIFVGSHGGPIEGFEQILLDFAPVAFATLTAGLISGAASGWYNGFLWADTRLGQRPETALAAIGGRPALTGWTSSSKLSGMAAWMLDMKFDEKGERWASGIPATGAVAKWVKAYDPRLDSTYPGGSGAQRWDDESTWTWTENPGLHALTYARGRFMGANNVKVVGAGIRKTSIDIAAFVALANICDANGWTVGGHVYEAPGISKWTNLKTILDAAAAKPAWVGGTLTVRISAPRVALDTITKDDLADGEVLIPAMTPWKDKFNTIVPRYRSEDHRWEYVQAAAVVNSAYLAEDGEPKSTERQYALIQDADQAAQRAAYDLANDREYGPIRLPLKAKWRYFRPGEALNIDVGSITDDAALGVQLAVIKSRRVDPRTGSVTLEFESETSAKHAWALGQSGVAPPTPTIPAAGDNDQAQAAIRETDAVIIQRIEASGLTGMTFTVTVPSGGNTQVTVSSHTRVYPDKSVSVNGNGGPVAVAAAAGDLILGYYDDPTRTGGAVTYHYLVLAGGVGDASPAYATPANPYRHNVFAWIVPAPTDPTGGGSDAGSGGGGGGGGGGGWNHLNSF